MTNEGKRQLNEKKFPNWEKLPNGGRRYWLEVKGRHGWQARYIKELGAGTSPLERGVGVCSPPLTGGDRREGELFQFI